MDSMRQETDKALADYDVAQNKIGDLDSRLNRMTQDIENNAKELSTIEAALRSKVKGDLKVEHILRSSGKIIGGAMQLIPVGQPVVDFSESRLPRWLTSTLTIRKGKPSR